MIQLNFKSPKAIVWWQPLDKIRTKSFFRLHFVFNFISIMHPWHTQVRAMHQIAVSNVSRILRSYDLVLLPYDLERDRTINKVCFAGIPSPTQHFFTWLCEQTNSDNKSFWYSIRNIPFGAGVQFTALVASATVIYLLGGRSRDGRNLRDVFSLNIETGVWTHLPSMNKVENQ